MIELIEIPAKFMTVRYVGNRIPGSTDPSDLSKGANCQLFAYELLKHFGKSIPDFRSSELWEDSSYTFKVEDEDLEAFDLVLFNSKGEAWGAHVGLFIGDGKVIHLSNELRLPAIWPLEKFAKHPKYSFLVGAKRLLN